MQWRLRYYDAEQHKLAAIMNLPITTIVAGVGIGYANATQHIIQQKIGCRDGAYRIDCLHNF